jgi:DNA-binding CsgD family transcriptional regulator/tetratricopeptide (TPR) repeat protein
MLERDAELAALAAAIRAAGDGRGSAVLISGEAGIGKSSLVEALRSQLPAEGRMFVGYCDDLTTPRTLGPFRDLVGSVGTELSEAVTDGDRDRLLPALLAELNWPSHPAVLVIEDVHWADEATLDALRYLVRRVAALPAVVVLTYRDDELGREHRLHRLLGQASRAEHVHRLPLHQLSAGAVQQLSESSPVSATDLLALSGGNPFFIHELLASAHDDQVPPSVADAVLDRVRRLDPATQDLLEQLSVVPAALDRSLADVLAAGVVPDTVAALAAAEQRGLLTVTARRIGFRHELTRRAVVGAVPAARLIALNQRVLTVLAGRDGADVTQLVHHAAQAGDLDAIARYGPAAARDAARAGAHREAAALLGLVLEHAGRFAPAERAALLEQCAVECYTIGAADRSVAVQRQAVALRRELGEPRALGSALSWQSRIRWMSGDRAGAVTAAQQAAAVLEQAGDPALLAQALSHQSQLSMLGHQSAEAISYGQRAVTLARQVGDAAIISHALNNIGCAHWFLGDAALGLATINEALTVALDARDTEDACRAYVNIIWSLVDWFRLDEADRYLAPGLKLAEDAEFVGFYIYLRTAQARQVFARGDWGQAAALAHESLDAHHPARCVALTLLGRIQIRRGEPGAEDFLGPASELATRINELQRTGPVAAARAEAAWFTGDNDRVVEVIRPAYEDAVRVGDVVYRSELGCWLALASQPVTITGDLPYGLLATGRWRDAAQAFAAAGARYEQALALSTGPGPDEQLAALAIADELGAAPLALRIRTRLRDLGVTRIPRGPAAPTRANPAGLTARQLEVLRQLGQGSTNAQIAERLVLSVRTVDSHVAALLDKLGVTDRRAAAARAAELGVLDSEDR